MISTSIPAQSSSPPASQVLCRFCGGWCCGCGDLSLQICRGSCWGCCGGGVIIIVLVSKVAVEVVVSMGAGVRILAFSLNCGFCFFKFVLFVVVVLFFLLEADTIQILI